MRRAPLERIRLPHHIGPRPRVLFVGINPGVRSALTGHHFAGYSNRFWRLLHESGLVSRPLKCEDDACLPEHGFGITNLIGRPSPGIDTLRRRDYAAGRRALIARIRRYRPRLVALVGVTLYRALFARGGGPFRLGLQRETLEGVPVFALPNPSGRNATLPYGAMLGAFRGLRLYLARDAKRPSTCSFCRRPRSRRRP